MELGDFSRRPQKHSHVHRAFAAVERASGRVEEGLVIPAASAGTSLTFGAA